MQSRESDDVQLSRVDPTRKWVTKGGGETSTHISSEQIDDTFQAHTYPEHGNLAHRPGDDIPTDPRIGPRMPRSGGDDDRS